MNVESNVEIATGMHTSYCYKYTRHYQISNINDVVTENYSQEMLSVVCILQ